MTQGKADSAAAAALSAGGIAWLDILQQSLEWGVLILGFVSGCFALYWNIKKYREAKNVNKSN